VDVVNATDDRAVGDEAVRLLADAGITVATVTDTGTADATRSAIEYRDGERAAAGQLAGALGAVELLRPSDVERVTVVLGATDASVLVEALRDLTGLPCTSTPASAADDPNG
jgi:hypothetical protein